MKREALEKKTLDACSATMYYDIKDSLPEIEDEQLKRLYREFKRHKKLDFCCITVEDHEEIESYRHHEPEFGLAYEDFLTDVASEFESTAKFYSFETHSTREDFISTLDKEVYVIMGSL